MIDLIASCGVILLNRFLHVMPMRFNLWLGRSLSVFFYVFSGKRRAVTYSNIRASFCSNMPPEQIKKITRRAYTNAAQMFVELVSLTKVDDKYIEKYIRVINYDRISKAASNPSGMILLSAHFGNWELSLAVSASKGFPLYVLARDQKLKKLNELFNKLRESKGSVVVRKGTDIKRLIRVLKQGKAIGILADQNAGAHGELLEFFGRPASTAVGPYRLAQKEGAVILPAFIHRKKGPFHELVLEDPIVIKEGEDIKGHMRHYNALLEKHIRQDPDHWFWMHKKWKMNPVKKVLVLDDGRKGHLNQSLAVVEQMRKHRENEGYDREDLRVCVLKIKFKGEFRKTVFRSMSPFFNALCQGRSYLLRWALEKESWGRALSEYADIIVSTGTRLAAVNMFLKTENNARNVSILDPGKFRRSEFDLIIIPAHDFCARYVRRGACMSLCEEGGANKKGRVPINMVVTELAPNLIDPEEMSDKEEEKKVFDIGLLFGGDNRYFSLSPVFAERVVNSISGLLHDSERELRITTSRRTSPETETAVKKAVKAIDGRISLTLGSEDTDPDTVKLIMKKSSVLVVSGESISMVSEAVCSGKRVIVFMPEKNTRKTTKYELFVERLALSGYLELSTPQGISESILRIISCPRKNVFPQDMLRIRKELYRLF